MISINVQTEKSYDILLDSNWLEMLQEQIFMLYKESKKLIVIDENVFSIYESKLQKLLLDSNSIIHIFPSAESNKNLDNYVKILENLSKNNLTRKDIIVAVGGGVVGDVAGFAAATYLRGIEYVQVPTTLLAMIDSSIGGKTAIDFMSKKNIVGSFHSPALVCIDVDFINTLPEEEILSGNGELIKYAVLSKHIYALVMKNSPLLNLVIASIKYKKMIVEKDFKESNLRMLLNLGHTVGHAIEVSTNFTIKHGAAVALGILQEAKISKALGLLSNRKYDEIVSLLQYRKLYSEKQFDIKPYLGSDKKMGLNNEINIVAIRKIGKCEIVSLNLDKLKSLI